MDRKKVYFVADVHLGLDANDPAAREERFVHWLRGIDRPDTKVLWLLGDIWDFWYEYRDLIPREAFRVAARISGLLDSGIEVYWVPGNHDIWLYSFWQKLGVKVVQQPQRIELDGQPFLLGHGDALGGAHWSYRLMLKIFHNRSCQVLFNQIHPWLAYRFGTDWSNSNRRKHGGYKFQGEAEPLYKYCLAATEASQRPENVRDSAPNHATEGSPDTEARHCICIFGHFHDAVDMALPTGARLIVLKDWIGDPAPHFACWDGENLSLE